MTYERWMYRRTDENGEPQVVFVKELDGWSFLNATRRGDEVREERVLDLNDEDDRELYVRWNSRGAING